ncbi:hypothetical protein MBANPS3_010419 [Mucor bainieri]
MQSALRMVSNYAAVSSVLRQEFLQLVHRLRTTNCSVVFVEAVLQLSLTFPDCRRWRPWWLQPSVSSMIFCYGSKMKTSLASHPMLSSSLVESYHGGVLYYTINAKTPMPYATRQLLQFFKDGLVSLRVYFDLGITTEYGTKERKNTNKRILNYYKESDSRAPDNTEALLGDSNSQINKKKRKQKMTNAKCFDNIEILSQTKAADDDQRQANIGNAAFESLPDLSTSHSCDSHH